MRHFRAARDDRDGGSRYRASKMRGFPCELGWYRERLRPYEWVGSYFFMEWRGVWTEQSEWN